MSYSRGRWEQNRKAAGALVGHTSAPPDRGFSSALGFCAALLSASDPVATRAALEQPLRRERSPALLVL